MRLFTALLLATALVLFVDSSSAATSDTLTILHINDTHSNLTAHGPRGSDLVGTQGGIARAATVVGMTRMSEPNVVFLHAGDYSIGDLIYNFTFGVPELQILQQLGLDAMAVGNHEFDLTPEALMGALPEAFGPTSPYPFLSANAVLDSPSVSALRSYVQPHLIKDFGGIKVGIIGLTTPEANVISQPSPVFIDTSIDVVLEREITALVTAGTHVNILLSHMGRRYDEMIAASTPYLHVIVGGHDHDVLEAPEPVVNPLGDTTWIVQAGANYSFIGKLRLTVNGSAVRPLDYRLIPLDESVPPEHDVDSIVTSLESYVAGLIGLGLEHEVATTDLLTSRLVEILAPYHPASMLQAIRQNPAGLTELLTDLPTIHEAIAPVAAAVAVSLRAAGHTDLGMTTAGATAQPLPPGPITGLDLYRMIGYGYNTNDRLGYRLATFDIRGSDLLLALEWGLSSIEYNDEYFPVGFPLRYTYSAERPPFTRVDSVWIGGTLLDSSRVYSVTTNEFVLAVLAGYVAPQLGITIASPNVLDNTSELLAVLTSPLIVAGAVAGTDVVPAKFSLEQNYPNPFNPETEIGYTTLHEGWVRLAIYDLLGREVAVLVDEVQGSGWHVVPWRANAASGVYFYQITFTVPHSGTRFSQTRKMVLQK